MMNIDLLPEEMKSLRVKPVDAGLCKVVFFVSVEHSIKILADIADCNDFAAKVASKQ